MNSYSNFENLDPPLRRAWSWRPQIERASTTLARSAKMPPPVPLSQCGREDNAGYCPVGMLPEDVPVDFLEGWMDLTVVLPSKKTVRMSVERRTPMMDLLVQVTTAHKVNPGGHVIQVMSDRSDDFLFYKPSTPIGALDTSTIHIIPKQKMTASDSGVLSRKIPMRALNLPFETTFRLQIRLPKNQLYVLRVSPKVTVHEVLIQVCNDKGFDLEKYDIRHPDNLDERLIPSYRLAEYQLTEVALVPTNRKTSRSVSTSDILKLQQLESNSPLDKNRQFGRPNTILGAKTRSSAGDSSLSSGSLGGGSRGDETPERSFSPVVQSPRQMMMASTPNLSSGSAVDGGGFPLPNRMKKRRAPPPPGAARPLQTPDDNINIRQFTRNSYPESTISHDSQPHFSSNMSTISTGSMNSINSVGKKRRAPVPPRRSVTASPLPLVSAIPEETPSLLISETSSQSKPVEEKPRKTVTSPSPAPRTAPRTSLETGVRPLIDQERNESPLPRVSRQIERPRGDGADAESVPSPMESKPETKIQKSKSEENRNQSSSSSSDEETENQNPTAADEVKRVVEDVKPVEVKPRVVTPVIKESPNVDVSGADSSIQTPSSPPTDGFSTRISPDENVDDPGFGSLNDGRTFEKRSKASKPVPQGETKKVRRQTPSPLINMTHNKKLNLTQDDLERHSEEEVEVVKLRKPPTKPPRTFTASVTSAIFDTETSDDDTLQQTNEKHRATISDMDLSKLIMGAKMKKYDTSSYINANKDIDKIKIIHVNNSSSSPEAVDVPETETASEKVPPDSYANYKRNAAERNGKGDDSSKLSKPGLDTNQPNKKTTNLKNPLSKMSNKKLPKDDTKEETNDARLKDVMPNFRMAPAATVNVHGPEKKRKRSSTKRMVVDVEGIKTVEESDSQENAQQSRKIFENQSETDEDLVEDLYLFSADYKPPAKEIPKAQVAAVSNKKLVSASKKKAAVKSKKKEVIESGKLTEQEEKILEEAAKEAERLQLEEEARRQEKLRRLHEKREEEERVAREKIQKSRNIKLTDPMAKPTVVSKPTTNEKTETIRHQLKNMMTRDDVGQTHPQKGVELNINFDDDDLLPMHRQRSKSSSSSSSSSSDADDDDELKKVRSSTSGLVMESFKDSVSTELPLPCSPMPKILNLQEEFPDTPPDAPPDAPPDTPPGVPPGAPPVNQTFEPMSQPSSMQSEIENSLSAKHQDISDALEESFAKIDFGTESEDTSSDHDKDSERAPSSAQIWTQNENKTRERDFSVISEPNDESFEESFIRQSQEDLLPDPPSGFKDPSLSFSPDFDPTLDMLAPQKRPSEGVPVLHGPMKFSIGSYKDRESRAESASRPDSLHIIYGTPIPAPFIQASKPVPESPPPPLPPAEESPRLFRPQMQPRASSADNNVPIRPPPIPNKIEIKRLSDKPIYSTPKPLVPPPIPSKLEIRKSVERLSSPTPPPLPAKLDISRGVTSSDSENIYALPSKPTLPSKPEREMLANQERSKTYVGGSNAPWVVRKISLQGERVVPNDDLVLNKARRQKNPSAGTPIVTLKPMGPLRPVNIKALSTGNLERTGLDVVELNSQDDEESSKPEVKSTIQETLEAIKKEILTKPNVEDSLVKPSDSPFGNLVTSANKKKWKSSHNIDSSKRIPEFPLAIKKTSVPDLDKIVIEEKQSPPSPNLLERSNAIDDEGDDSDQHEGGHQVKLEEEEDDSTTKGSMFRHSPMLGGPPAPPPMHNQRIYHYGGPPSIQMSTWKDRSRVDHAPPGRVFNLPGSQMPPAGHGSGMPPASRMAAGYYSLQYNSGSEPDSSYFPNHLNYQNDPKYTRDALDEQQRAPQLRKSEKASVSSPISPRDNFSAKPWIPKTNAQIIKNIDLKYGDHHVEEMNDPKVAVLVSARKPSAHSTEITPSKLNHLKDESPKKLESRPVTKTLSSDSAISNGSSSEGLSTNGDHRAVNKPQFYFGQNVSSIVKSSPFHEQQAQTAIEKVKLNEALTHPKLKKNEDPKVSVTKINHQGRHLSVITVEDPPNESEDQNRKKSTSVSPGLSSTVSSLSSPTSSSSSSSGSSYAKQRLAQMNHKNSTQSIEEEESFLVPRPKPSFSSSHGSNVSNNRPMRHSTPSFGNVSSRLPVEPSQDQTRRAFEAELMAGKSRLRKSASAQSNRQSRPLTSVFNGGMSSPIEVHEVGVQARPPPAPVPPPPPPSFSSGRVPLPPNPPPVVSLKPVNGEIPQAPKLTHFGAPSAEPQRKGMVAPNGLSAREELMQAIRGKGGFHGLRKTNSGKNL